ncbi:Cyclic AMP receptor-like protein A [Colletotrichum sp. SAR11_240]|nr:Cyclic AMP receptor-like protein A [Colletotrichum sp. SAR11_240]
MGDSHGAPVARATSDSLSQEQIDIVIALERVGASLSLVGVTLIFITYYAFKRLRTVPNLFILMASIANVGASVACAMGFMQSDPWWSFAMAINVFLVFFAGANPSSFRKHLWVYCLVCFGIPLIPALSLLLLRPDGPDDLIYGDSTLWCWINNKWSVLRIYTYYIPIWCCIFGSCVIYFAVGYHVFHQRNQLRNLTFSNPARDNKDLSCSDERDSAEKTLDTTSDPSIGNDTRLAPQSANSTRAFMAHK